MVHKMQILGGFKPKNSEELKKEGKYFVFRSFFNTILVILFVMSFNIEIHFCIYNILLVL